MNEGFFLAHFGLKKARKDTKKYSEILFRLELEEARIFKMKLFYFL